MAAQWMTVDELGAYIGVGRVTAYRLVWSGEVARTNIAPKGAKRPSWRVSRAAADAWLASRTKGGSARKVA